eukprot:scaffold4383_cov61-Cyclotella_meneghiniana.AAC.8
MVIVIFDITHDRVIKCTSSSLGHVLCSALLLVYLCRPHILGRRPVLTPTASITTDDDRRPRHGGTWHHEAVMLEEHLQSNPKDALGVPYYGV